MLNNLTTVSPTCKRKGFTMVELMVVLAILSALLVIAAPGFRNMILANQMLTELYALRATLSNARSEALARRAPVVVCPSLNGTACEATNNWRSGYMTFVDTNNDNTPDPGNPDEEVIQFEPREMAANLLFDNTANRVRFNPRGTALGFEGTFTFCDERGSSEARALILNPVGSLRSATDTDSPEDGIVNDAGGANVAC